MRNRNDFPPLPSRPSWHPWDGWVPAVLFWVLLAAAVVAIWLEK